MVDIKPPNQLIWVLFWCNWGEKDGNYALDGLFLVNYIERMDGNFPHGKDFHIPRTIRSQTPVLTISIPLRFTHDKLVEGFYPLSYGCVVN